ncbi:hypothetical protein XI09_03795 [Bradyrhizobium sp. CCBAU 11386]|nr:hypothetical protein [Bradyrhizobium sp. CCBAU 11386]
MVAGRTMNVPSSVPFILGVLLTTAVASVIALFVSRDAAQTWDILKLALQGIGALIFARYGVVWAFETFKSQKRWERDAATFSNVLAALREMERANEILWDDAIHAKDYTDEYVNDAKERWRVAKKKFEEAATGSVFLPDAISTIVLQLEADLANAPMPDTYQEHIDNRGYLVSQALKNLERKKRLL